MKTTKKTTSTKTSSSAKPAAATTAATNKGPLTGNTGKHLVLYQQIGGPPNSVPPRDLPFICELSSYHVVG